MSKSKKYEVQAQIKLWVSREIIADSLADALITAQEMGAYKFVKNTKLTMEIDTEFEVTGVFKP
jgi:hypothetical protein